jgi:indolepyruvate ferredoxin oxidoreductase beta subunit
MIINCLITGVGGQGTVLLARLAGGAAMKKGFGVRGTETIGMAQRGGSVVSHIRIGDTPIHSPLIPQSEADVVIAFEPAEAVRVLPFLSPEGTMIALDRAIIPASSSLRTASVGKGAPYQSGAMISYLEKVIEAPKLSIINGESLIARCGSARVINVALLGAALELDMFPFTKEDVISVLQEMVNPKYLDLNIRALDSCGS